MSRYRYPGLRSFEESDAILFNGREKEKQALFDLLMVERSVVLFAKSGAGKTSLLRAGIVPMLNGLPYQPVFLRLNRNEEPLFQQVFTQITAVFGIAAAPGQTLWEYLKTINDNSGSTTPILFFDQFEELFTLYEKPDDRKEFITQLADVINGTLPVAVEAQLNSGQGKIGGEALIALEKAPRVKVVFAIRSDLLSYLHELAGFIPGILRNRFELKGLRPEQAALAITRPAAVIGAGFECPPFRFAPEALKDMLENLAARRQDQTAADETEIETFQLQLVCDHIEQKMLGKHQNGQPMLVEPGTYGGKTGIDRLLSDFYQDAISDIPGASQRKYARVAVEDELIKNERRVSVAEAAMTQSKRHALHPDTLRRLVDKRLLRREERPSLGNYYELVHDTLLGPVLAFKREREIQERLQKALFFSAILASMLLVAFAMFWVVNNLRQQARYSYLVAESKLQAATDPSFAFWLGAAAWKIFPDSTQAPASMMGSYYGPLLTIGDSVFAAPHYRAYEVVWAKPVSGNQAILLLRPDWQTLLLVDPYSGKEREILPGSTTEIQDAVLSPDGRRALTIHPGESTAQLWDTQTGAVLQALTHQGALSSAAFSPNGRYLTTNSADALQRLWTADGKFLKQYTNTASFETLAKFSPDSKWLLVGEDNRTLKLYPLESGQSEITLNSNLGYIHQVHFSNPDQFITVVSSSDEGNAGIQVFDLQGKRIFERLWQAEEEKNLVTVDNSGEQLLLVFSDGQMLQVNIPTKELVQLSSHSDQYRAQIVCATVSSDHQWLATGGNDKTVNIWYQSQFVQSLPHRDVVIDLFFTAGNRYLATCSRGGKVRLWGLKDNPIQQLRKECFAAFFKPGTREVATLDFSGHPQFWDSSGTSVELPRWLNKGILNASPWGDGATVLVLTSDSIQRWDVRTGALKAFRTQPPVLFSPAAQSDLLALYRPDAVELIRLNSSKSEMIPFPGQRITAMCLSPDGRRLVLAQQDSIKVWDIGQRKFSAATPFSGPVEKLALSPDGKTLLIGSPGTVYHWGFVQTPAPFLLNEHDAGSTINSIAWSVDGRYIATGAMDQKVALWDYQGRHLHTFELPTYDAVYGLQFSDDGRYLLSQHFRRAVFVWPLDPELLTRALNQQGVRKLTAEERRTYEIK